MKTSCFDAVVNFSPSTRKQPLDALFQFKGEKTPALFYFYEQDQKEDIPLFFVFVQTVKLLSLKWKNKFTVEDSKSQKILGEGKVLNPLSKKPRQKNIKGKISFLQQLLGDEKEMLFTLAQENGMSGLWQGKVTDFSSLTESALLNLSQELELEGKVKILSFSPLFLLSQPGFEYLCEKIISFLTRFHKDNPAKRGAPLDKIRKRFDLHPRIFSLALKSLFREGKIKELGNQIALADFQVFLSPDEEKLLCKMEEESFQAEFRSVSLEDLRKRFRLSSDKLNTMLSMLIERKKIVQGKDRFFLHSRWLDEIIQKIRKSGQKELSVSDFKEMTGLTRKYAIPLLELLDQMGITRRVGSTREILKKLD